MKKELGKAEPTAQTNYEIKRADNNDRFEIIKNYHLYDKRLNNALVGFLTRLYCLPKNWKITQRATAHFFNISKTTFNKNINELIKYGYITIKGNKRNATYILNEKPSVADFNPRFINQYTIKQLNAFINDNRIEQRYKELIKKALNQAKESEQDFNKMLTEMDEQEKKAIESDELPF